MTDQFVIHALTKHMMNRAQHTVVSLTEAIVAQETAPVPLEELEQLGAAKDAMVAKVKQMPSHLQLGMVGLTLSFSAYSRLRKQRSVRELPIEQRLSLLNEWRAAPIGPCRQFVQFYEKMGTFLYYSLLEESLHPPVEVR